MINPKTHTLDLSVDQVHMLLNALEMLENDDEYLLTLEDVDDLEDIRSQLGTP